MVQGSAVAPREGGFATAAAIGVCAALATVVVALLQLTQSQRDRVAEEIEREEQEQAIQSAIALEIAELAGAPRNLPDAARRSVGRWTIEVQVTNEQAKVNVLSADIDMIAVALQKRTLPDAEGMAHRIVEIRDRQASVRELPLSDLLHEAGVPENFVDCLGDVLTVHGSSLDPLATGRPESMDGGVLNLRASIVFPRPSNVVRERVFVVTGDRAAPVIELSDKRFPANSREECRREES